jgi:hypothetical protein
MNKMKRERAALMAIAMVLVGLSEGTGQAAPIDDGTVVGVDFGAVAPSNNFNQVNSGSGSIAAGSVIDTNNVIVDGVGVLWVAGGVNNDASVESEVPGQPAVFDDTNLTDWLIAINSGNGGRITLTFTGLDDTRAYDLLIGAAHPTADADCTWTASGQSGTIDCSVGENAFVTLTNLVTDGSGNLYIASLGVDPRTDISAVSALTLTATTNVNTTAPSLTHIGTQFGLTSTSNWRTVSTAKPFDLGGDDVLGSDGYYMIGNNQRTSQPKYVSSWSVPVSTFGGSPAYAYIDDPDVVPPGSSIVYSGTANPGGSDVLIFSFVLGGAVPDTIRLTVMMDGLDDATWNPDSVQVKEIGGGAQSALIGTTAGLHNDTNPDWLFFNVRNVSAGSQIGVYSSGGLNTLQVFAFDSVPPPAGTVLIIR